MGVDPYYSRHNSMVTSVGEGKLLIQSWMDSVRLFLPKIYYMSSIPTTKQGYKISLFCLFLLEMQTVPFRVWSRLTLSISYNRYTTSTSKETFFYFVSFQSLFMEQYVYISSWWDAFVYYFLSVSLVDKIFNALGIYKYLVFLLSLICISQIYNG